MSKWRAYPLLVLQIWTALLAVALIFENDPVTILIVIALMRMQEGRDALCDIDVGNMARRQNNERKNIQEIKQWKS